MLHGAEVVAGDAYCEARPEAWMQDEPVFADRSDDLHAQLLARLAEGRARRRAMWYHEYLEYLRTAPGA
jgi:hypothetical protein